MSDEVVDGEAVEIPLEEQPRSESTELAAPPLRQLPNPFTGQVVDLDADSATLAQAIRELRDLDEERRQLVKDISHELLQRMDMNAEWTMHLPGLDVSAPAPGRREYKSDRLVPLLEQLVKEGKITKEAAQKAVEVEVKFKVKKRGVDAIKKLGGDVGKRIYGCEVPVPDASRSVTVKVRDDARA